MIAPLHEGASPPCNGCGEHRPDAVAVVTCGLDRSKFEARFGWIRALGVDVLNAPLQEKDLGTLAAARGAPTFTYTVTPPASRPGPTREMGLTVVPPAWWREMCRDNAWDERAPLEARWGGGVLRRLRKVATLRAMAAAVGG